jgi:hypothetical protein
VREAVLQWLKQKPKKSLADRIRQHMHQWDCYLNACGDFFLTVAVPSPVSILEQVAGVHASYHVIDVANSSCLYFNVSVSSKM